MTFLSDPEGKLLDELGIVERDAPGRGDIAFPTSILVDEDGIVRWVYTSDTYRQRARPEDVFAAIDAMERG